MPRQPRIDVSDNLYHVINRANRKEFIFTEERDFKLILNVLKEVKQKIPIKIFSFTIMYNHWHFAIKTTQDKQMADFFGKLTQIVTQRWHQNHDTVGTGHLFQSRFKSFLVGDDEYFLQLMRYIEANPLKANMVRRAEDWPWGSLSIRENNKSLSSVLLDPWPIGIPKNYLDLVNDIPGSVPEWLTKT